MMNYSKRRFLCVNVTKTFSNHEQSESLNGTFCNNRKSLGHKVTNDPNLKLWWKFGNPKYEIQWKLRPSAKIRRVSKFGKICRKLTNLIMHSWITIFQSRIDTFLRPFIITQNALSTQFFEVCILAKNLISYFCDLIRKIWWNFKIFLLIHNIIFSIRN